MAASWCRAALLSEKHHCKDRLPGGYCKETCQEQLKFGHATWHKLQVIALISVLPGLSLFKKSGTKVPQTTKLLAFSTADAWESVKFVVVSIRAEKKLLEQTCGFLWQVGMGGSWRPSSSGCFCSCWAFPSWLCRRCRSSPKSLQKRRKVSTFSRWRCWDE